MSVTNGNDTLDGIAAQINDASIGVTASVVKEADSQYALVIQSSFGAANAIQLAVTEDDASTSLDSLAYTSYSSSKEKVAATDAEFTVDGVEITRSTNTVTDVLDGVTLSLNGTTSSSENVSASYSTDVALLAAQGIVTELNTLVSDLKSKFDRGGNGGTKGDLAGDPLIRRMISEINSITTAELQGFGYSGIYLANYGILTNRDGSISLDATTFKTEYEKAPDRFNAIVNSRVTTASSLVTGEVTGANYTPGSYAFTISDGSATVDGDSMSLSGGVYYTSSGSTSGLKVSLSGSGTNTTINMGRSFIDKMAAFATEAVKFGNDSLTRKYTDQFAAMDLAVASMNNTKESLTSMMDAWKGSMK